MAKMTVWKAALGGILISAWTVSAANAQSLSLSSPDIKEGGTIANEQVFKGFGCTGGNISPALSWSGAPSGTKSFAVSIYDPDAPTGSGWWHWVVFNLPPGTASLPKGAGDVKKKLMPKGAIQSRTDFGSDGYGGPCPPRRRQAASLPDHGFCGGRRQAAGCQERCGLGGAGRLRPAFPYLGEGDVDRSLRPLGGSVRATGGSAVTAARAGTGRGATKNVNSWAAALEPANYKLDRKPDSGCAPAARRV